MTRPPYPDFLGPDVEAELQALLDAGRFASIETSYLFLMYTVLELQQVWHDLPEQHTLRPAIHDIAEWLARELPDGSAMQELAADGWLPPSSPDDRGSRAASPRR